MHKQLLTTREREILGLLAAGMTNGGLVGDGKLDVMTPEALLYEPKDGKLQLVGVEYIVFADAWDANHDAPPVLMGSCLTIRARPTAPAHPHIMACGARKTQP